MNIRTLSIAILAGAGTVLACSGQLLARQTVAPEPPPPARKPTDPISPSRGTPGYKPTVITPPQTGPKPPRGPNDPISPSPGMPGYKPSVIVPPTPVPADGSQPNGDQPLSPNDVNGPTTIGGSSRNLARGVNRPFGFQSPRSEARFNTMTQRLTTMEARMDKSNQDVLRRVGEARQLTGERQNRALLDLLQSMVQDRSDLQRYLVQSRSTWTGDDFEESGTNAPTDEQPAEPVQPNQPNQPGQPAQPPR